MRCCLFSEPICNLTERMFGASEVQLFEAVGGKIKMNWVALIRMFFFRKKYMHTHWLRITLRDEELQASDWQPQHWLSFWLHVQRFLWWLTMKTMAELTSAYALTDLILMDPLFPNFVPSFNVINSIELKWEHFSGIRMLISKCTHFYSENYRGFSTKNLPAKLRRIEFNFEDVQLTVFRRTEVRGSCSSWWVSAAIVTQLFMIKIS